MSHCGSAAVRFYHGDFEFISELLACMSVSMEDVREMVMTIRQNSHAGCKQSGVGMPEPRTRRQPVVPVPLGSSHTLPDAL